MPFGHNIPFGYKHFLIIVNHEITKIGSAFNRQLSAFSRQPYLTFWEYHALWVPAKPIQVRTFFQRQVQRTSAGLFTGPIL
jgi:hypothetical protein